MTVQDNATLKGYFNTGDSPSESNFADLIDSATTLQTIFTIEGNLSAFVGALRIYNNWGVDRIISEVFICVNTAPTGASIKIDVHKDGTTIFTTQSNRPEIAISGFTANSTTIEVDTWADGEYLTMDVDQIGSTILGANLTVHIIHA